jgi:hypothetical protein
MWRAYLAPRPAVYNIHFQVWRPSPTSSHCYHLVGENRFPETNVTSAPLWLSPQSGDVIAVRPGDVLGYFVSSTRGPVAGIQTDRESINDVVYHTDLRGEPLVMGPDTCPVSVGPEGMLNSSVNAAPVINAEIGEYL